MRSTLALCTAAGLAGCLAREPAASPGMLQPQRPGTTADSKRDDPLAAAVLAAARDYKAWTRVSDQAHWAPQLCRPPATEGAQFSDSKDQDTHGKKLYFLYAKLADSYRLWPPKDGVPVGQSLVKESFVPVEVDPTTVPTTKDDLGQAKHPAEYALAAIGGKAYKTGDPGPLFVMVKLDPKTPNTDEGWVYGAVKPDGRTVVNSGRIAACMQCHTKTAHDRLFGPVWAREKERAKAAADQPKAAEQLKPTSGK